MRRFVVLFCLPLAACSQSMGTQLEYINKLHHVQMADDTYRIYDHPKGDRLMVSPSMGKIAVAGAVNGLTVGLANTLSPAEARIAAAQQFMNQTGRSHCRPVSSNELMRPNVQVVFDCSQG